MALFHNYYQLNITTPHVPHQSFYVCAIFFTTTKGVPVRQMISLDFE
jgi:hypothetical protein